ncbi:MULTISPECIES: hypothetical protein [Pantoea]|uniref:Glycine zipper 2TM domain-containing protein n=3 Tax=Pantoea TaxID=53335 RepID=A0AAU7U0L8_9GAMM|nr:MULTISPECIES: hypothetical protein [Pantoea]MBD9644531.1 hypothetical protein [Pantoea sp. PNT02]MBY4840416.1 hypothetical protein [Pantoea sp. DY-5]MBY4888264.1 hypothetical protein [Pantoea sp. DY-15]MBY4952183.1 hypothetical protein [Pantoea sp. DY-17]NWA62542.1 hypothetical protein [Pantoea sp. B9002]
MRKFSLIVLTAGVLLSVTSQVEAKGCIKGAVVGGVAGHVAHHGVAGAAAGCAVGHHMANKKQKEADSKQQQSK